MEEKQELTKREKRKIDDKIQLEKTLITESDRESAQVLPLAEIGFEKRGELERVRTFNFFAVVVMILVALTSVCGAGLLVYKSSVATYFAYFAIACLLIAVFMLALLMSRFRYMRDIKSAELTDKVIFSVSLKRTPYYVKLGTVYELKLQKICPFCKTDATEIVGDMHIERVDGVLLAVCNYNRKHFFVIEEEKLAEAVDV